MDVRVTLPITILLVASSAWAKAPARTTSSGSAERWSERSVHVTLDPSLASLGPHALDDVRAAFGAWLTADANLPRFVFEIGTVPGAAAKDGVPRVLATRDVARGHEKDIAYTVSWADVHTGAIVESDIVFNLAYPFGDVASMATCARTWDTRAVATHEVGHFLGLAEDMSEDRATMWFRTDACDAHKAQLGADDIAAIEGLYAETVSTRAASCSIGSTNSRTWGAFWALAPIVVVYMRRRSTMRRP